ncbi:hypothetical protein ASD8599_02435 [Ascidiaceihabitans donghaensis]|uniref:Uncharacterized protein n=1 Tax=Ascidiaceihabitans donghaensis TaxID=1510460 RepID=A0A2R8BF46_9RHOB|nr:hypothetical protein [Ascidiaceihabitans donghaensis]SPH21683.1 hypothetical protein ASD8599_02435 [Ascidiaceihabitans donghaensis]
MTETSDKRIKLEQRNDALLITIRAKRNVGICLFLGFWLVGWAVGWISALGALILSPLGFITLFLLVWLCFWTVGGLVALSAFLWMVSGKEEISISDHSLIILRRVPFWSKPVAVAMTAVSNMRVVPNPKGRHQKNFKGWRSADAGVIHLTNGTRKLGFGLELDPVDARKLVDTVVAIFPTLKDT